MFKVGRSIFGSAGTQANLSIDYLGKDMETDGRYPQSSITKFMDSIQVLLSLKRQTNRPMNYRKFHSWLVEKSSRKDLRYLPAVYRHSNTSKMLPLLLIIPFIYFKFLFLGAYGLVVEKFIFQDNIPMSQSMLLFLHRL